jgi:hypothetical protein
LNKKVTVDYEFTHITDEAVINPFNKNPKGIVAFRVLSAKSIMWPNILVQNEFAFTAKK